MPTTTNEAVEIVRIAEHRVGAPLNELFTELDEKVGKGTVNPSLKQSLSMLRAASDNLKRNVLGGDDNEPFIFFTIFMHPRWFVLWMLLILVHAALVLTNVAAFFVAPFYGPWYFAAPACFSILWVTFSRSECPLTRWENVIRAKMGWRPIGSFIGHYFMKYVYRALAALGFLKKPE